MQYRTGKDGNKISLLGYGCMRFTAKGGRIDLEKAEKEILAAYNAGVNYFDTAYIYPGSEAALGEIVERNQIRDKINITTKLPQYLISSKSALDKIFNEELNRLRTDYVDYYLMHHLTDFSQWEKLKSLGIIEWIAQKKQSGQIRHIGFSFHGDSVMFKKILDDYDWDICLIQYNYLDEKSQAGVDGLKHAASKNIPVVIMEPLRGGKLVTLLPDSAKRLIQNHEHKWTAAEWAFRWLYNQPEVTCVLSGMNSEEMVSENCRIASQSEAGHFSNADFEFIEKIKAEIKKTEKVGCTGCRYCMPCPRGIDIPGIFRCYNAMYAEGKLSGRKDFFQSVALRKDFSPVSQCINCGKCEKHCPQNIPIREQLKVADRALEHFPYNVVISLGRKFMLRDKVRH